VGQVNESLKAVGEYGVGDGPTACAKEQLKEH
jgi:hypothetical protein